MGAIRFLLPALLAITGLANAQSFGDLSSCGQNCINNMRESTPCVPVTDQCLCENTNFQAGIRDCATQACAAADAGAAIGYANSFCVSAMAVSSTAAATTSDPATTTDAPTTTTAAAETTTTPVSSTETTSSEVSSIAAESSTTSAASTEATSFSTSTTASAGTETSSSKTSSEKTTKTSASSSFASSTGGATAAPPVDNLSVAGKAGIAVGVGAVGVCLLALALAMCKSKRARRPLPRGTMQISEPLPGSGRLDYDGTSPAQNPNHPQNMAPGSKLSTAFNMAELDHARPYEEMVPRVTPRRMV